MTMHERRARTMRQLYEALGDQLAEFPELGDLPVEVTDEDGLFSAQVLSADLTGGSVLVVDSEPFWHEPFVAVRYVSVLQHLVRLGARVRHDLARLVGGNVKRKPKEK
jgi:hypothetical protein